MSEESARKAISRRDLLRGAGVTAFVFSFGPLLVATGCRPAPGEQPASGANPETKQPAPTAAPAKQESKPAADAKPTAKTDGVQSQTAGFKISAPSFDAKAKAVLVFLNSGTSQTESMHQNKWTEKWNKENPDVQVDLQYVSWADNDTKQRALIAAGTAPDCAWYCGNRVQELELRGWVEPLDGYMADVKGNYTDDLFKTGSPSMSADGKRWLGIPFCQYGEGLVIRKDVFEKAGVTDLKKLQTWNGWLEALQSANKPPEMYAFQLPQHPDTLTGASARFFTGNGLAHIADFRPEKKDAYLESMEFLKKVLAFSPSAAKNWRHGDEIAAWTAGNIASMGTGSYFFGDIIPTAPQIATREKMAAIAFPHGPRIPNSVNPSGFCGYHMFKDSKHKDETAKFLKFLASPEANNEFPMNMSPNKNAIIDTRVEAYKMYSPQSYKQVQWWYEDWTTIFKTAEVSFGEGYIPSAEIDKTWQNVFPSWAFENTPVSKAYDDLKAQVWDSGLLKNKPTK
jgi:ABC-type glycerol-3-phosphate transport system substrate-binding protein